MKLFKTSRQIVIAGLVLFGSFEAIAAPASEADLGLEKVEERSFRAAIRHLSSALDRPGLDSARRAELMLARGLSYRALLDHANAATDFQEVLALQATSAEACYQLGMMYRSGQGMAKDPDKELHWLTQAADKNHIQAQRVLGQYYFQKSHYDLRKSHSWIMKAATGGDTDAQRILATRYLTGRGLIQNANESFRWYLRAAEEGDPVAQLQVAKSYFSGKPVQQDQQRGMAWLTRSAGQGYLPAEYLYGQLLASGEGIGKDPGQASRWFWRAAELGRAGPLARS